MAPVTDLELEILVFIEQLGSTGTIEESRIWKDSSSNLGPQSTYDNLKKKTTRKGTLVGQTCSELCRKPIDHMSCYQVFDVAHVNILICSIAQRGGCQPE